MQNQEIEYQKIFKNIYYNLYSNGTSSRAERIVSDITKILMCKLICESQTDNPLHQYITGDSRLENTILPIVKKKYPQLFEQFEGFSLSDNSIKYCFSELENIKLSNAPAHILDTISKSQDPQILFLELCFNLLKPNGKLGIILPEGVFGNKSYGYIWKYLLDRGKILGMIDCPRNTFQPSTDTKTNILFYQKGISKKTSISWVATAKHCGHDKRGRMFSVSGEPIANDFNIIAHEYKTKRTSDIWIKAKLDGKYFVPRYYAAQKESMDLRNYGEITTLGELIESKFLTIKSGHEIGSDAYGTGTIPFVRTSDINNFEISCDPTNSVSEEVYMKYKEQQNLQIGDILFIADGRYRIGKTAILNAFNLTCIIQSHIDIISISDNILRRYWCVFCLIDKPCKLYGYRNTRIIISSFFSQFSDYSRFEFRHVQAVLQQLRIF